MKLISFTVTNYRCIEDSGIVEVDPHVTCLVGKNESGKTALLQALRRINPDDGAKFDVTMDYPRRRLKKYERRVPQDPDIAVTATFKLESEDLQVVEGEFGEGVVTAESLSIHVDYDNEEVIHLDVDEARFVEHMLNEAELDTATEKAARKSKTLSELAEQLKSETPKAASEEQPEAPNPGTAKLQSRVQQCMTEHLEDQVWAKCLKARCPQFMYFDHYRVMRGTATLDELANDQAVADDEGLHTLKDLLDLAVTSPEELKSDANYEAHKANLEAAANEITDEVFEYWRQNPELEVDIDVHRPATNNEPAKVHVRIKNRRHRVTVPFDERSRGFVWFFSFLAAFNKLVADGRPVVVLLDEPGLNLHASAQSDLLRFIEKRLVPNHQVLYTTHSPFMVDANALNRVRTVEDVDQKGTNVSCEFLSTDDATVFPLQAALGYDLAQTLFLGPNCVLVEGPSDLIYLQLMSTILEEKGRTYLDARWVVVPVGGADKIATFAALLGANQLNIAVLLDFAKKDQQKIGNLVKRRLVDKTQIVSVADFAPGKEADIEDLLGEDLYLPLIKATYPKAKELTVSKLPKGARLVKRVEKALKTLGVDHFDHFSPSRQAMTSLSGDSIPDEVLQRFEKLFEKLNTLLENGTA